MSIYEFLGVNIFRKCILFTWEKIAKLIKINVGYRLNKFSIEGLNDKKKDTIGYAKAHLLLLITISVLYTMVLYASLLPTIAMIFFNIYCVMVQRYNYIRIKKAIEKMMPKIEEQIKEIDSSLTNHEYVITDTLGKETIISFDKLIETATPEQLIIYRRYLLQFQEFASPPPPEDMPESIIYQKPSRLAYGKRKVLTLRFTKNKNSANN